MEAEFTVAVFGALTNLLLACAAIAGAIIAGIGLNTWKNQSVWQADSELAKEILLTVYHYRNSLYSVRHPAMSNSEMELGAGVGGEIVAANSRSAGIINAYAKRWEKHSNFRSELDAALLEADAVWGSELRMMVEPLLALEHELYTYIIIYIDAHHRGNTELAKEYKETIKKRRDILYDLLSDETDEFRKDFKEKLLEVEKYLREKLGRA